MTLLVNASTALMDIEEAHLRFVPWPQRRATPPAAELVLCPRCARPTSPRRVGFGRHQTSGRHEERECIRPGHGGADGHAHAEALRSAAGLAWNRRRPAWLRADGAGGCMRPAGPEGLTDSPCGASPGRQVPEEKQATRERAACGRRDVVYGHFSLQALPSMTLRVPGESRRHLRARRQRTEALCKAHCKPTSRLAGMCPSAPLSRGSTPLKMSSSSCI